MTTAQPASNPSLSESPRQRTRRGFLLGCLLALVILILRAGNLFTSLRLDMNNVYFLPSKTSGKIIIVALDNRSLATYGRSPTEWSRAEYTQLMEVMQQGGARVVTFDLLFVEETPEDAAFAEAIRKARMGEDGSRVRTILAMVAVQPIEGRLDSPDYILQFNNVLTPNPVLAEAAENLGYANAFTDADNTVRRQLSLVQVEDHQGLSLSLATYMAYLGIPVQVIPQLLIQDDGILRITPELTPDRKLYIDEFGLWQQGFFGSSEETFQTVSFVDVLTGQVDPAIFQDKIVLVGLLNATGAVDRYNVPIDLAGSSMAGVEIQANAIETLLQEKPIRHQSLVSQLLMIVILTIAASLFYAHLRWYWIILMPIPTLVLGGIVAFLIFDTLQIIVDLFYVVLSLAIPPFIIMAVQVATEISQRQRTEFLLQSVLAVSTQQMDVERMLPLIASDIQRVVKTSGGAIYLWDDESDTLQLRYHWFPQAPSSKRCMQYFMSLSQNEREITRIRGKEVCIPIFWQRALVGGFYIELTDSRKTQQSIRLLEVLAQEVAPSLVNARLFSRVQRQTQLLQAVLDGSPNGIMILNPDLTLASYNPGSDSLLRHVETTAWLGKSILDILQKAGIPEETLKHIREKFAAGGNFQDQLQLDSQVYYLFAVRLIADDKWVLILNDVSTLAELNELKTQMIRMASHDLKNPLTNIMSYVSFIEDDPQLGDDQRRFLDNINKSATQMLDIISGILNLEQVHAGKLEYEPLYFHQLVGIVAEQYMGEAAMRRQTFTAEIQRDLPQMRGDFRMLSQAISNLIGNAIKYTPDNGQIKVRLFASNPQTIRLEVEDNGYGIPADAQAKLFTQFYRVRTAATAHIRGTGLGLSLVKSVIEHHGGKIWVQSVEGKGSTFFVELPIWGADGVQT